MTIPTLPSLSLKPQSGVVSESPYNARTWSPEAAQAWTVVHVRFQAASCS